MSISKSKKVTLVVDRFNDDTRRTRYKNAYYHLVMRENLNEIKKIIKNHGYYDTETINKIRYNELNGLPYFFVTVDSADFTCGHYAMLDGIYLDVNSIIPQWHGKFYLSIVMIRKATNEKVKRFINPAKDIEHELIHLHRLIDYIDKHPGYLAKSIKYNMGSCGLCDLDKSIEFEVEKIFSMEVPALISDFDTGQKDLYSYENGTVTKITVNNKDEFLRYKVGLNLADLNGYYIKRFPDNVEQIRNRIKVEANKQGRTLFGDNCMMLLLMSMTEYFSILKTRGVSYDVGEI